MLTQERWESNRSAISAGMERVKSQIWTALPVIVDSYDAATQTVTVQPAIKGRHRQPDGTWEDITIGLIPDVPVKFPSGGGATFTFPIKKGDEGTIKVCSRNIDQWFQKGGVQNQGNDLRSHELTDSFFELGGRSYPRRLSNVNTTKVQLRTDDGSMVLEFDPEAKKITITNPDNAVEISGDLHVKGDLHVDKEVTAQYGGSGAIKLSTHLHSGVQTGGGTTAAPVPGT